jgi:uncharacterized protein YkwD
VPRKVLPLIAALLALAVPASAQAAFMARRVEVAKASPAFHHRAKAADVPAGGCPNADLMPAAGNLAAIRAAVLCLHNQERVQRGLRPLQEDTRLRRAALGHSADMVQSRYFEHTTRRGVTMVDRIVGAGYVRADQGWMLGENLEWGTGTLATPRSAVKAWMNSPDHRANLLKRGYEEMGVGVVLGVPVGSGQGATYTVDFGTIR